MIRMMNDETVEVKMMINLVILLVVIVRIVGGDGWMLASEEDGVSVEGLVPELV